jgi:hypothetical protein
LTEVAVAADDRRIAMDQPSPSDSAPAGLLRANLRRDAPART